MGQVISDAATVLRALDGWLEHYNAVHPHKVQGYRWPRELRKADGGGRDGQCDRRSVSTGGSTLCRRVIGSNLKPPLRGDANRLA